VDYKGIWVLPNDFEGVVNAVHRDNCEHWSENFFRHERIIDRYVPDNGRRDVSVVLVDDSTKDDFPSGSL